MKVYYFLFILLFTHPYASKACDVCGGVSNGFNLDLTGQQASNSIGVGYRFIPYKSSSSEFSKNSMVNMVDIYGSYSPVKNLVIISSLSYLRSNIYEGDVSKKYSGLGDMSILFNYKVLSKVPYRNGNNKHGLSISAGIELPTGKYINDADNLPLQQIGSRSVDFLLGLNYQVSLDRWWISNSTILKLNTNNKSDYRFGNSIWNAVYGAYSIQKTKHLIRPMIGFDLIHQQKNVKENIYQEMTGGTMVRGVVGLSYKVKDFQVSALTQIPIYQHMNNPTVRFLPDLSIKLFYILPTSKKQKS